ncbi:MAG: adenylate/guanylate cyclase domain-containing protein [Verrucomicrobia bacterium]|nr:adenylate/guanylate cyclase domain-containing protein [Verrucomicrobiota bacterium]
MNKPSAATISQGAGAFARVLHAEQLANALRLNQLRFTVVIAFLLLEVLPFIPRMQMMNRLACGILLAYAAVSGVLVFLSRRSERITHFSRLAIPLIDMPLVFFIQLISLEVSDAPRAVSNFTLALLMGLILLAALSLDRWQVVIATLMAVVLEILLVVMAGEKLFHMLAGTLLLSATAAICEYARSRRIEMVWTICREHLQRERLGRYFSPEVALVIEETADGATPTQLCEVTVLFSDLRDFTSLGETMDTSEIVALLNDYFEQMVGVVFDHGGTLDKYLGDGLMVYFGAPVVQNDHATRAVRCALAMQERLAEYNAAKASRAPLRMGIGIHTGPAVVGSMGASHRREYTAIGDTVNVAARIERLCKPLNETILLSGDTRSRCGDVVAFRSVSECSIMGRSAPVQVYSPG